MRFPFLAHWLDENKWVNNGCNSCFIIIIIFWLHPATCEVLVPQPEIEPCPLQWKLSLLTAGLPGNSLSF